VLSKSKQVVPLRTGAGLEVSGNPVREWNTIDAAESNERRNLALSNAEGTGRSGTLVLYHKKSTLFNGNLSQNATYKIIIGIPWFMPDTYVSEKVRGQNHINQTYFSLLPPATHLSLLLLIRQQTVHINVSIINWRWSKLFEKIKIKSLETCIQWQYLYYFIWCTMFDVTDKQKQQNWTTVLSILMYSPLT
jgi:hypothetical protein